MPKVTYTLNGRNKMLTQIFLAPTPLLFPGQRASSGCLSFTLSIANIPTHKIYVTEEEAYVAELDRLANLL